MVTNSCGPSPSQVRASAAMCDHHARPSSSLVQCLDSGPPNPSAAPSSAPMPLSRALPSLPALAGPAGRHPGLGSVPRSSFSPPSPEQLKHWGTGTGPSNCPPSCCVFLALLRLVSCVAPRPLLGPVTFAPFSLTTEGPVFCLIFRKNASEDSLPPAVSCSLSPALLPRRRTQGSQCSRDAQPGDHIPLLASQDQPAARAGRPMLPPNTKAL